jgi:hypothetical protein
MLIVEMKCYFVDGLTLAGGTDVLNCLAGYHWFSEFVLEEENNPSVW